MSVKGRSHSGDRARFVRAQPMSQRLSESGSAWNIASLQWAVGAFCAVMGALMLVAPHQFDAPAFALLKNQLSCWGVGFIAAGVGLLLAGSLAPKWALVALAHAGAGAALIVLAAGFVRTGVWSGTAHYLVLGIGTAAAPLFARDRARNSAVRYDALALTIGFGALLGGVSLLTSSGNYVHPRFDLVRPHLGWFGVAFCLSGALLFLSHIKHKARPSIQRWARIPLATVLLVFGTLTSLPTHDWTGTIYCAGFGATLVAQSLLGARVRQLDPYSFRTRLALVLAGAVALPLVAAGAAFAHNQEALAITEQLGRQRALAEVLARDAYDYVNLNHAAVKQLAGQPGLLALSPSEQRMLLKNSKAAFPDVVGFGTVSASGDPIARSDDRAGTSWIGDPLFEAVRQTRQPSIQVLISPVIHTPIFSLGAPVLDGDGQFLGIVSASIEASRIAAFLDRIDFGPQARPFLVDATGHVIAHDDQDLVVNFADRSAQPSVAALLADPARSGSLDVTGPDRGLLASYTRVPTLGWGVVVEQPAAAALATIHAKLDLFFLGLILTIAAAAGFGVVVAGWLVRPLETLGVALDHLAMGESTAPLRVGGLTEIVRLSFTFNHLRKQLAARTAERELAESALKHQALHDPLTGLPNRALFTDRLQHALSRRDRDSHSVALLFIDLNHFKAVNDSFGHAQGDALLVGVSKKLRGCMRNADTAARLGGDEFTVLLEDIDGPDEAIVVAQRIASELARPIILDGGEVAVSASIGISIGGPQVSARRLLHEADVAMYHGKRNGVVYQVYQSELNLPSADRASRIARRLRSTSEPVAAPGWSTPLAI